MKKNVVWFEEVDKNDVSLVGGKGANLGEMAQSGFPVPYGFIVTANAYFYFLKEADLKDKIRKLLDIVDYHNNEKLQRAALNIQELILMSHIPIDLTKEIESYYSKLRSKEEEILKKRRSRAKQLIHQVKNIYAPPYVAIRSSATAEDLPTASFAGQQETYLNIKGENELIAKIRECFASLFTARAMYYRFEQGFLDKKIGIAVVVQRMIQSERSGVSFSVDPVTNNKDTIIIEAIFGLGEYIVQGKVTPDHYEVAKGSYIIKSKQIGNQNLKLSRINRKNQETPLSHKEGKNQKLSDEEIVKVALLTADIEKHYFFPQDIEWAIENSRLFVVQTRPITTIKSKTSDATGEKSFTTEARLTPILIGSPASPGVGIGPVRVVHDPKDIGKVKSGDILLAEQTNPDYVPAMKKAVAIVTEKGGRTSHAAIVSRELGIPAVVGAEGALKILKEGQVISVNGQTGEVFSGSVFSTKPREESTIAKVKSLNKLKTLTKVYVNLAEPERAKEIAQLHVDGIGLLRAEFIIAQIGIHPKEAIRLGRQQEFMNKLYADLKIFIKAFTPRPVIYRATDFKSNEYRNLKGGKNFEEKEENPMLGFRGAARYINDPESFEIELQAIKKILDEGYKNLHLMIPFLRLPWELIKIKELIQKAGLFDYQNFKLYMMVETPSSALNLEEFLKIGVDGVSIGSNDLTMLLLAVDRDNANIAGYYDERNPVVTSSFESIIKTCIKYNIECSICGQAPSDYSEIVELLVKTGVTSVSVNPDAISRTRELIFETEKKIFKKAV